MLSSILERAWWALAGQRALRTFLVALVPFVPAVVAGSTVALWAALSTGALAAVLSLAWSLRSLPEVDSVPRPWWLAALERAARTFGQALIANIPAVTLLQDVPWWTVLTNAAAATVGTVVLAIISELPETTPTLALTPSDRVQLALVHDALPAGDPAQDAIAKTLRGARHLA